jgi:HSP20 family molecular chaperone IbpA
MTFIQRGLDPFDILVRNFFNSELHFAPVNEAKIQHPVDILETDEGLHFEIACTGLTKKDIEINIEGDVLRITYDKGEDSLPEGTWVHRGIARRSFNLGYKIAPKFDLGQASAEMENGLLKVAIPFADEAKPKVLKIK